MRRTHGGGTCGGTLGDGRGGEGGERRERGGAALRRRGGQGHHPNETGSEENVLISHINLADVSHSLSHLHFSTHSGFASVASVNVIIALYVVTAFREDKDEEKREPVPAVGVWAMQQTKERTD